MIQSVINFLYRTPKSELKKFGRFGGYYNYQQMMRGKRLMERQSSDLPPVYSYKDGLPVYFLTGKNHLYQTLFCIQSLSKVSTQKFEFVLVDDGTFDAELMDRVNIQLPNAVIIDQAIIKKNLNLYLPEQHYPVLHQKRKVYPHIKKLTDIHTIAGNDWKLVLDSDMLFWHEPLEIIEWLKNPHEFLYMIDCEESYGYSKPLMEELSGSKIPSLINVGAIGLNSNLINWKKTENWVEQLEKREGTSYYLEQALSAMLIGQTNSIVLNAGQYKVNPEKTMVHNRSGVLHHYVDLSKEHYYKTAWKYYI